MPPVFSLCPQWPYHTPGGHTTLPVVIPRLRWLHCTPGGRSGGMIVELRSTKRGSPSASATAAAERRMGRCIFEMPAEEKPESDIGAVGKRRNGRNKMHSETVESDKIRAKMQTPRARITSEQRSTAFLQKPTPISRPSCRLMKIRHIF